MINLAENIKIIANAAILHRSIYESIQRTIGLLELQAGKSSGKSDYQTFAFAIMLRQGTLPSGMRYDGEFLSAAMAISQVLATNSIKNPLARIIRYSNGKTPPATGMASLKRGLKLMLVELWAQRLIILPTTFTVGAHFPTKDFAHPLLDWVLSFDPNGAEPTADGRRLHYYGPRLLFATDWHEPQDVTLSEIAAFARARVLYQQGKSNIVIAGGNQLPLNIFAAKLHAAFPDTVPYTAYDLKRYSHWSLSHAIVDNDFDSYNWTPEQKVAKQPRSEQDRNRSLGARRKRSNDLPANESTSSESTHDVLLRNFATLTRNSRLGIDWQNGNSFSYPGREHVDISGISPSWILCFRSFIYHRKVIKGYRSTDDVLACLNLLADYLFYYLPWWKEISPNSKVELPTSPRLFTRYAFVTRHTPTAHSELPATLLELIRLRRPSNESTKITIHQLSLFFDFVKVHFATDEIVAGNGFNSPINSELDSPRIETKSKTTKEVIPKHIYGYLLFYCYAIEQFGMHLERIAKEGSLSQIPIKLRNSLRFKTFEFGQIPHVVYRGKKFPLQTVPNVFTWGERELQTASTAGTKTIYVPHCSALRVLITALETGLRVQSIQWLDKNSWRSLGKTTPEDSYTFPLLVNTDKTKTNSWRTYVVHRVRDLMRRQEAFQAQFADADAYGPVEYEGLDTSPFDSIQPLFRATHSGQPLSDTLYAKTWVRLLVDFEAFYREVTGEQHVRMYKLKPRLKIDGTPVINWDGEAQERPYCAISTLAIHTPHACRATFATNRKGVLELSDAAELLGHSNEVVTAYYDKPSENDLRQRLHESDTAIVADFTQFQLNSDVHVRADKPDSALVKSFNRNRKATVKAFKFMEPISLWSTDDSKSETTGITLLREGPMSRIRFRETHICPVGEECPTDILEQIGEPRRCGICPLAMKCIDHLPAIAAKRNQLLERILFQQRRRKSLESAEEPEAVLDEIWGSIELNINELLGWQLSEEILERMRLDLTEDNELMLHVEKPDIVKRHLERVTKSSSTAELLLQRIADSNAYPSMTTPEVHLVASQVKRRLLAGQGLEILGFGDQSPDEINGVAAMLALMMKTQGLSMKQVAASLSAQSTTPRVVLTKELSNGR